MSDTFALIFQERISCPHGLCGTRSGGRRAISLLWSARNQLRMGAKARKVQEKRVHSLRLCWHGFQAGWPLEYGHFPLVSPSSTKKLAESVSPIVKKLALWLYLLPDQLGACKLAATLADLRGRPTTLISSNREAPARITERLGQIDLIGSPQAASDEVPSTCLPAAVPSSELSLQSTSSLLIASMMGRAGDKLAASSTCRYSLLRVRRAKVECQCIFPDQFSSTQVR